MVQGDVLQGELPTGSEGGRERGPDDFEHPIMLYSASRNRRGDKADGLFGRHKKHTGLALGEPG